MPTTKEIEDKLTNAKAEMEAALGVSVRVNVRHDRRGEDAEVYKTQVELEAYVEGPGQRREREEREAAERAAAEAEAKRRAEEEAAEKAERDAMSRAGKGA